MQERFSNREWFEDEIDRGPRPARTAGTNLQERFSNREWFEDEIDRGPRPVPTTETGL